MKKSAFIPAAAAVIAVSELYKYVFYRSGSPIFNPLLDKKGHDEDYYIHRDSAAALLRSIPSETFVITGHSGERLYGHYFPADNDDKKIAFIVHGYRSDYAETAGMYYDYYHSRGFSLFCCDHTASGGSEGRFIGFDVFESEDCLNWLDFLLERFGRDCRIILHGFSMGGATVLKMSSRCPDNVKFIVSDSGYISARHILKSSLGPAYEPLRMLNRIIAGYDLNSSDVRESIDLSRVPVLFVHGYDDKTVPFENGAQLYRLYRGEKDCLFVPRARHVEAMHVSPAQYQAKLDSFVSRYIL